MTDQEELESLLDEINKDCTLTSWEEGFVDDMLKLAEKGKVFSDQQGMKIEEIYERYFHC